MVGAYKGKMLKSKIIDHANSVDYVTLQLSTNNPATNPISLHSIPTHSAQTLPSPLLSSLLLSSPHLSSAPILSNTTTSLRLPSLKSDLILPNLTAFHHLSSPIWNHLSCSDLIILYNMMFTCDLEVGFMIHIAWGFLTPTPTSSKQWVNHRVGQSVSQRISQSYSESVSNLDWQTDDFYFNNYILRNIFIIFNSTTSTSENKCKRDRSLTRCCCPIWSAHQLTVISSTASARIMTTGINDSFCSSSHYTVLLACSLTVWILRQIDCSQRAAGTSLERIQGA